MNPPLLSLVIGGLYQTTERSVYFSLASNQDGQWIQSIDEGRGDAYIQTEPGVPILIIDYMRHSCGNILYMGIGLLNERAVIVYADEVDRL